MWRPSAFTASKTDTHEFDSGTVDICLLLCSRQHPVTLACTLLDSVLVQIPNGCGLDVMLIPRIFDRIIEGLDVFSLRSLNPRGLDRRSHASPGSAMMSPNPYPENLGHR